MEPMELIRINYGELRISHCVRGRNVSLWMNQMLGLEPKLA